MALTACRECGEDVAEKARACPYCGEPRPVAAELERRSLQDRVTRAVPRWAQLLIAVLVIALLAFSLFSTIKRKADVAECRKQVTKAINDGTPIPDC